MPFCSGDLEGTVSAWRLQSRNHVTAHCAPRQQGRPNDEPRFPNRSAQQTKLGTVCGVGLGSMRLFDGRFKAHTTVTLSAFSKNAPNSPWRFLLRLLGLWRGISNSFGTFRSNLRRVYSFRTNPGDQTVKEFAQIFGHCEGVSTWWSDASFGGGVAASFGGGPAAFFAKSEYFLWG